MRILRNGFAAGTLVLGLTLSQPCAAAAPNDRQFVEEAASAGKMEVALGRHASAHATDAQVKRFGQHMVDDHGKANAELTRIAEKHSIPVPKELTSTHQATVTRLMALKGAEFDREYMKAMVEDHEEDVAKFREKADDSDASPVRDFAKRTLPTLEEHLKQAKEINAKVEKHAAADTRTR